MVKKAVGAIKSDGARQPYAEISDHGGPFLDRYLYIVVYNLDGLVLAHDSDQKRIGINQIDDKDADGKAFVKDRVELAKSPPSFWQQYKFMNSVTKTVQPKEKTVQPKELYCERLDATVVCGGICQ